ncbi:MAG: 1-(5-phosphoribosyl)-5-[(5-phosphoribosylamino)methylideneamino]imidazole-4-carboxamide isomerase [Actinomycetota bacterium]
MTFEVIPAIDVSEGRLVRMSRAETVPLDVNGGNPEAAAAAFVASGATRLHFVDVDLARTGVATNLDHLRAIAALGVPVQASGGVTSAEQIEALISAGADRVVLGSAALVSRDATERSIASFQDRLCIGIEASGPTIRPRRAGAELPLWDTLLWLGELDVSRYVFTEVDRVGELRGPELDGIWALATHTGKPVIASGGIRSIDDLAAVARLGGGVEGAVVGRALHEGLDLAEALRAVG